MTVSYHLLSMELPHDPTSALSPGVYRLLLETGISRVDCSEKYLKDCGTLDWEAVQTALPCPETEENAEYFQASVYNLAPLFKLTEDNLSVLTSEEFSNKYKANLEWIECNQIDICIDVFKMLRTKSEVKTLLAIQLLTSTIERALGDVFSHQSSAPCPSMLKDLLTSSQINNIFGPVVIQVLRTVIGPPISLNLRNIVWHGFCKPEEIPSRYGWFLLLILPSLGQILKEKSITVSGHRAALDFPEVIQYQQLLSGVTIEECEKQLLCLSGVFDGRESVVLAALECYKCREYGFAVSLLLPQMEHALRCIYAVVNNCPERIMTAEATTLYTTFDEILDCSLPNNDINNLNSFVGEPYMDMLHDLLVYPEGPRVRDRLSHGEVDWYTFPRELALGVILAASLLTVHYQQANTASTEGMPGTSTLRLEESYQSMFHPVSIVKDMVRDLMLDVNTINRRIKYTSGLLLRSNPNDSVLCDREEQSLFTTIHGHVLSLTDRICLWWSLNDISKEDIHRTFSLMVDNKVIIDKLLKKKIPTLYLFQKQECTDRRLEDKTAEKVILLKHILTECITVVKQLNQTLTDRQDQFDAKQLRSRQRANLQKLIGSCPFLNHTLQLIALIVIWQMYSFHHISVERVSGYQDIKFLKTTLQLAENLRTNTKVDKNKWKESTELCSAYVQRLKEIFTKL